MKKSKYSNKKTIVDNITFDSKMEADYYKRLKSMQEKGEITSFSLQPSFELIPTFRKHGKTHRKLTYKADFKVIYPDGHIEILDVKGTETEGFKIKRKLFEYMHQDLEFFLVKRKGKANWVKTR